MPTFSVALPELGAGVLRAIATRAGCTPEAYASICLLTGLAEQLRFRGEQGALVADQLSALAHVLLEEHGVATTTVQVPREVRSILQYEIEQAQR